MKTNTKKVNKRAIAKVAGGAGAETYVSAPLNELRRATLSCMLWEDAAYEGGESVAQRISSLIPKVPAAKVAELARQCRNEQNLRHVPLHIACGMLTSDKHRSYVSDVLKDVIQRPDELSEFVSLYWKNGKKPLAAQAKKGLAAAFGKFDEYQLAKYRGENKNVSLRDVMRLVHPRPATKAQGKLWKKLLNDELKTPVTWETEISAKGNKAEVWEKLLREEQMGAMALIRNLRNMTEAKVNRKLIVEALAKANCSKVLPFRFIAAANENPQYEAELESMMLRGMVNTPKLKGRTILILDVSGSMGAPLSSKSKMDRLSAGNALAMIAREFCEDVAIYATAGSDSRKIHATKLIPNRRGFALAEAVKNATRELGGGGIFLNQVIKYVGEAENYKADRILVFTDEQDCSGDSARSMNDTKGFGKFNYILNVSNEKHSIAEKNFTHINGWSEAFLSYIRDTEE